MGEVVVYMPISKRKCTQPGCDKSIRTKARSFETYCVKCKHVYLSEEQGRKTANILMKQLLQSIDKSIK